MRNHLGHLGDFSIFCNLSNIFVENKLCVINILWSIFYFQMMCSFSKLLWQFTPRNCNGVLTRFDSLNQNIDHLLSDHNCHSVKDPPVTMSMLFINRLTPCTIPPICVGNLDVCRKHLVSTNWKRLYFKIVQLTPSQMWNFWHEFLTFNFYFGGIFFLYCYADHYF